MKKMEELVFHEAADIPLNGEDIRNKDINDCRHFKSNQRSNIWN